MTAATTLLHVRINDGLIDDIVDVFFEKMLDDYAVNRLFNGKPVTEQSKPLKVYLKAMFAGLNDPEQISQLLDDCFMAAFAKSNIKSNPMANDFDFLMEIAGGKDLRVLTFLCDAHSHFLKFKPDDFHYDVIMKHLTDTLKQLKVDDSLQNELLELAEGARDAVLGREPE
jgi:truncated hemoglobin YjbI